MRGFIAALTSSEIYQGCRTPSERSKFSESSSEPTLTPSASARESYEGFRSPDSSEPSFRSADNERVVDGEYPAAADAGNIIADNERVVDGEYPSAADAGNIIAETSFSRIPFFSGSLLFTPNCNVKLKGNSKDGIEPFAGQTFTLRELAAATKDFSADCLLGQGGLGRVYKGRLKSSGQGGFGRVYKGRLKSSDQVVAIKQFYIGTPANEIILNEVLMRRILHHPNIVNFVGSCADGKQRLMVHEYMPLGSLEYHLHDLPSGKKHLDWNARMKIAVGVAKGLEFLHDKANPPVILPALKSSSILLGEDYHPKLSDIALATNVPVGGNSTVSRRVRGTSGYIAPEYAMSGQLSLRSDFFKFAMLGPLSLRSDIFNFGVVLLEIITGRKAIDTSKDAVEPSLLAWARSLFKDRTNFEQMADPMLQGQYPKKGLWRALTVAVKCLREQPAKRPLIADVVTDLTNIA